MQAGRRYTFGQSINWTRGSVLVFTLLSTAIVATYVFLELPWMIIPWQPISLIGVAVAFYLGFKNNSSYERLWEARKIWGGIVNASRTFTVMSRDFVTNEHAAEKLSADGLRTIHQRIVHRHIAWLYALTHQLRVIKDWEHNSRRDMQFRKWFGMDDPHNKLESISQYLNASDVDYLKGKGNKASHLLSLQSLELRELKAKGLIEDFRHMEMENMIKEFYTLQGKSERIKNFPFPRQYASANYFFVVIFLALLPFSMLSIFSNLQPAWMIWLAIPFSVVVSWVFWFMEKIGDYSENPFEGLYNDVPISAIARSIEIDIRQMLDETDLPEPLVPQSVFKILH